MKDNFHVTALSYRKKNTYGIFRPQILIISSKKIPKDSQSEKVTVPPPHGLTYAIVAAFIESLQQPIPNFWLLTHFALP